MKIVKSLVDLPELLESDSHKCTVELEIDMEYVSVNVEALSEEVEYLYAEDLRIIADHLDELKNKS